MSVLMSAATCGPGSLKDAPVARVQARIADARLAAAVLVFSHPVGYLPGPGPDGSLYGGLLWSDIGWLDFVLRPSDSLGDVLAKSRT